jgi:tRNA (guanine37-N1)-methyltransferase
MQFSSINFIEHFYAFVCNLKNFMLTLSLLSGTGYLKKKFMRIDILTVLPEMIDGMIHCSILQRAQEKGLAEIFLHNLRDYTTNKWRRVDDYPFGGEAGMVMQIEPVDKAISMLKAERHYDEIIYTSPDGEPFNQPVANHLSMLNNIIILCGHYKGVDYRIREHFITKEISIGDYVLTGGELAAAVIADAIIRIIPGVIGDEQSALSDSFQDGLLAPPVYTRPAEYKGWNVPDILLSGHERKIQEWRLQQARERTERLRPDLLNNSTK